MHRMKVTYAVCSYLVPLININILAQLMKTYACQLWVMEWAYNTLGIKSDSVENVYSLCFFAFFGKLVSGYAFDYFSYANNTLAWGGYPMRVYCYPSKSLPTYFSMLWWMNVGCVLLHVCLCVCAGYVWMCVGVHMNECINIMCVGMWMCKLLISYWLML